MRNLFVVCVLFVGCKKPSIEKSVETKVEKVTRLAPLDVKVDGSLHAVSCGDVTAIFAGKIEDVPSSAPKSFATSSLSFRFSDGKELPFKPTGELNFSDWNFNIFSTDCSHVSLLVDHTGPFHLVKTLDLRAYLGATSKPVEVRAKSPSGEAMVHAQGLFTSTNVFEFVASCCGGAEVYSSDEQGKLTLLLAAPKAEKGVLKTKTSWEIVQ